MHRTKVTAFIAFTVVAASLLFLSTSPVAKGRSIKRIPAGPGSISATFPGIAGIVAQAGQILEVKWALEGDGVRYFETHPWGECELFFSADAGQSCLIPFQALPRVIFLIPAYPVAHTLSLSAATTRCRCCMTYGLARHYCALSRKILMA